MEKQQNNPIKTSYELLWAEVRNENRSNVTIQNTLRRILGKNSEQGGIGEAS